MHHLCILIIYDIKLSWHPSYMCFFLSVFISKVSITITISHITFIACIQIARWQSWTRVAFIRIFTIINCGHERFSRLKTSSGMSSVACLPAFCIHECISLCERLRMFVFLDFCEVHEKKGPNLSSVLNISTVVLQQLLQPYVFPFSLLEV